MEAVVAPSAVSSTSTTASRVCCLLDSGVKCTEPASQAQFTKKVKKALVGLPGVALTEAHGQKNPAGHATGAPEAQAKPAGHGTQ